VILATRVPGWVLFPALAMLMLAPQVWNGMVTVLPDQTLSYLLALAAVASVLWLDEGRRAWLGLAVVLLAAAALTKLEGVLFGGVLALIVVVTSCLLRGRRGLPALILLLGPLAIVPWRVWLASHDLRTTSPDYALSDLLDPDYLGDRVGNLTLAIRHTLDLVFDSDRWTPTLALTLAVLLLLAPVLRMLSAVVVTWLVLSFLAIATVYWIGRPEIHWYLNTSAYRVAAVLPFVAGTLLPLLLGIALSREAMTRERVRTVEHGTAAPATTEAPRTLTRIRGRAHSRE
jgi:hypothetical protein